jgi:hypothetical protein
LSQGLEHEKRKDRINVKQATSEDEYQGVFRKRKSAPFDSLPLLLSNCPRD